MRLNSFPALALLVLGLLAFAPSRADEPAVAQRPDVAPGDRWQYQTTNGLTGATGSKRFTVDDVTASAITGHSGRSRHVYTRDWSELEKQSDNERITNEPAQVTLAFPLEVAKRWDGAFVETGKKNQRRWRSKGVVERIERVTVPAGTFDAFKVRVESYHDSGKAGKQVRVVEMIWYAPEVKRWVRRETHSTNFKSGTFMTVDTKIEELVSFRPGGQDREALLTTQ